MTEEWRLDAACRDTDPETFHPETGGSTIAAKRLCGICPVTADCLNYALERRIEHGVWGGMSPTERRPLLPPPVPGHQESCRRGHTWMDTTNVRVLPDGRRECLPCARQRRFRRAA